MELRRLSNEAGRAGGARKSELGIEIYGLFNQFVATYLSHMYREEHELQEALWDNFTDEELGGIEGALMASVSPELMAQFLPLICGSFNPDELPFMLGAMKGGMPPEVFQGMIQAAEQATPARNWGKVRAAIS